LEIETVKGAADCDPFESDSDIESKCAATQDLPPAETVSTTLGLAIITASFITNENDFLLKWENDPKSIGYRLSLTSDAACKDELLSFMQFDNQKTMGVVNDGTFFVCVYSLRPDNSETPFDNNGIAITIDRTRPQIDDRGKVPENIDGTKELDIPVNDLTEMTYLWTQENGPGKLTFTPPDQPKLRIDYDLPGLYKAVFSVTDLAGNTSSRSYTFETKAKDVSLPAGSGTITLAAGALYTQGPMVSIQLSADGASQYRLCADAAAEGVPCSTVLQPDAAYTDTPAPISLPDGPQTIYVQFTNSDGKLSVTANDSVMVDSIAPIAPAVTNPPAAAFHNSGTLAIDFTPGTDVNLDFTVLSLCTDSLCTTSCLAGQEAYASPYNYTGIPDGTYHLCAQEKDKAGLLSAIVGSTNTITIDATPPLPPSVISFAGTTPHNSASDTINFTVGNDPNLRHHTIKACTDAACTSGCVGENDVLAPLATGTVTGMLDGTTYHACIAAIDEATNASAFISADPQLIDLTPPSVSSVAIIEDDAYYKSGDSLTVQVNFTEPVDVSSTNSYIVIDTGATDRQATYSGGTGTATISYTYNVLVGDTNSDLDYEGTSALFTGGDTIQDTAGNTATLTLAAPSSPGSISDDQAIVIDAVAPSLPSDITIGGGDPLASNTMNITYTDGTDDTNFSTHNIKSCTDTNCTLGCVGDDTDTASDSNISGLLDATSYYACVETVDLAGNVSGFARSTSPRLVDTTKPSDPTLVIVPIWSTSLSADVSFTLGGDTHLTTHKAKACDAADCTTCGSEVLGATSPITVGSLTDGNSYFLCVAAVDSAGNESNYIPSAAAVTIDTTYPTGTITLDSGNAIYTTDHEPEIALTQIGATEYQLCPDSALQANDCVAPIVPWAAFNASPTPYDFVSDGSKTLYVQFRDAAGNTSATFQDDITISTGGYSIDLDGGSTYYSGDTSPPIGLVYSVAAVRYRLCGTADCSTELRPWAAVTNNPAPEDLLTEGLKNIWVEYEDSGNVSLGFASTSITIDNTPPDAFSVSGPTGLTADNTPEITWVASNDTNGVTYDLTIGTVSGCATPVQDPSGETGTSQTLTTLTDNTYFACITATDAAGLSTIATEASFTVDTTAPTFTSIDLANEALANSNINKIEHAASNDLVTNLIASGAATTEYRMITDATTCDAGVGAFSATIPKSNDPNFGASGDYRVCIKLADSVANTAYYESDIITFDETDPGLATTVSITNGSPHSGTAISINYTAGTDDLSATTHNVKACENADCNTNCVGAASGTKPLSISGLLDATTYFACVQTQDADGNTSAFTASGSIVTDQTPATVVSVNSADSRTYFKQGDTIALVVNFSESVTITGTPQLTINDGNTGYAATYVPGPAGTAHTFSYTVQAGHNSPDLNYISTTALITAGGTILDAGGNPTNLTLPAIADANALAQQEDFVIDTTAPSNVGTVTVSEGALHNTSTINISWTNSNDTNMSTHNIKACENSGCTLNCVDDHADPATGGVLTGLSDNTNYYACVEAVDLAGNTTGFTSSAVVAIVFDSTGPVVQSITSSTGDGTFVANDSISIQVNFDEDVTVTGTPTLTLETGSTDRTISYVSGSGSQNLTFTYTVQPGDESSDLNYKNTSALGDGGGTLQDQFGNSATLTLPSLGSGSALAGSSNLEVDAINGSVTAVTSTKGDGAYTIGEAIDIVVAFSEPMNVTGSPRIALNSGASVDYTSGDGTASWTFTYTVLAAENIGDLDYSSTSALTLNGGTIKDSAGNDADRTLANPGSSASISDNQDIVIDTIAPSFTSIALANDAADNWINLNQSTDNDDLADTLVASGYSGANYLLIPDTTTCNGSAGSFGAMPMSNDSNFGAEVAYRVCVELLDAAGNTDYGESDAFTLDVTMPTNPSSISVPAIVAADSVPISYSLGVDTNLKKHQADLCTSNDCSMGCLGSKNDNSNTGGVTYNGLSQNTAYYACVRAKDQGSNNTNWIPSPSTVTWTIAGPPEPTDMTFSGGTDITVDWTSGGGSTAGYIVIRDTSPISFTPADGVSYSQGTNDIICKTTSTTCADTGLTGDELYYYGIYAYNASNVYSNILTDGAISGRPPYRYYRLKITSISGTAGYVKIADVQFEWDGTWQTNAMTDDSSGTIGAYSATIAASGNYSGSSSYKAYRAFDSSTSNTWVGAKSKFETSGDKDHKTDFSWLSVDFGVGNEVTITGMQLKGYAGSGNDGSPDDYILQYSSDGSNWYDIAASQVTGADTKNTYHTNNFGTDGGSTPDSAPKAPTNLNISSPASNKLDITYANDKGDTLQYLVVRKLGSAPDFTPTDGDTYTTGTTSGSNYFVALGASTSINDTAVSDGSTYYYDVYALDALNNYSPAASGSAAPGTFIASRYRFVVTSGTSNTSQYVEISEIELEVDDVWQSNNATGWTSGTVAGQSFSSIANSSNWSDEEGYKALNGSIALDDYWSTEDNTCTSASNSCFEWIEVDFGTTVNVTGFRLVDGSAGDPYADEYYFQYYDGSNWVTFSGSEGTALETSNPEYHFVIATGLQTPTSLNLTTSDSQIDISFSDGGTGNNFLVVRNTGSAPTFTPTDSISYGVGSQPGGYIVSAGSSTSINDASLTNGTNYYYDVYAYDGSNNYSSAVSNNASPAACGGALVGGFCWYLSNADSCTNTCASNGGYNEATKTYAGSSGSNANCKAVLDALGGSDPTVGSTSSYANGCHNYNGSYYRDTSTTTANSNTGADRACACNN